MSTAELDELLLVVKNTIYRIPSAAVHHDRRSPVDVSFERFSQMARSSRALMSIDAFMGASDVGRSGYSSKNIFAVDTSEGWVWCSRFQVQVPEDESKACNLGHSLVGASFIWPWYPAKSSNAYQSVVEQSRRDGVHRPLVDYPPAHMISTSPLCPSTVHGAIEVPVTELTREQRYVFMQLSVGQTMSLPRYLADTYAEKVREHIQQRQAAAPYKQHGSAALQGALDGLPKTKAGKILWSDDANKQKFLPAHVIAKTVLASSRSWGSVSASLKRPRSRDLDDRSETHTPTLPPPPPLENTRPGASGLSSAA